MAETTMPGRRADLFERINPDRAAIFLGALIMLGGVIALIAGFAASKAIILVAGLVLVGAGLARIAGSLTREHRRRADVARGIAVGVLYVVTGAFVLYRPTMTLLVVTLSLAMLFFAGGIVRIVASLSERHSSWKWDLAAGIVSTILGLIVMANWPLSSAWLIGALVGAELIVSGASLIAAGFAVRSLREPIEAGWDERPPMEQHGPVVH